MSDEKSTFERATDVAGSAAEQVQSASPGVYDAGAKAGRYVGEVVRISHFSASRSDRIGIRCRLWQPSSRGPHGLGRSKPGLAEEGIRAERTGASRSTRYFAGHR